MVAKPRSSRDRLTQAAWQQDGPALGADWHRARQGGKGRLLGGCFIWSTHFLKTQKLLHLEHLPDRLGGAALGPCSKWSAMFKPPNGGLIAATSCCDLSQFWLRLAVNAVFRVQKWVLAHRLHRQHVIELGERHRLVAGLQVRQQPPASPPGGRLRSPVERVGVRRRHRLLPRLEQSFAAARKSKAITPTSLRRVRFLGVIQSPEAPPFRRELSQPSLRSGREKNTGGDHLP